MIRKLSIAAVATVFALAGCGAPEESADHAEGAVEEVADTTTEESAAEDDTVGEPCFTVGDVGSSLSLDWELVVASRGASDHQDLISDMLDSGEDLADAAEPDSYPVCDGYQQIHDLNYKLSVLNVDLIVGDETDAQYEEIADIGNELLEISDDEGYSWDYEFEYP
ncbi:hypothetical protein [Brevibacterium renqingii]|uniref:hypothetical protein n=1 Tax=Brevibacterium renqingii TaxID=2776916 RepID=UPI001ADF1FDF|nr:hypothetical protein [Brevibacterium renqingii]